MNNIEVELRYLAIVYSMWAQTAKVQNPRVQVVSRQKLNSNRENIVLYSINLDVFSIAIEFLTIKRLGLWFRKRIDVETLRLPV